MEDSKSPMIKVESLIKRYNSIKAPILDGLDIEVQTGELFILVGRSGCGKTTLLNIFAGLDRPTSGSVFIDGIRIDQMSEDQLARFRLNNVGFVFQDYNLIADLTILENVTLPLRLAKKKDLSMANHLLEVFDISDLAEEKANRVSGGEAQRAAIARAMANNPKVLLADEPTGNLDMDNELNVMEYFEKVKSRFNTTIVLATHNRDLANFGSKIYDFNPPETSRVRYEERSLRNFNRE